ARPAPDAPRPTRHGAEGAGAATLDRLGPALRRGALPSARPRRGAFAPRRAAGPRARTEVRPRVRGPRGGAGTGGRAVACGAPVAGTARRPAGRGGGLRPQPAAARGVEASGAAVVRVPRRGDARRSPRRAG